MPSVVISPFSVATFPYGGGHFWVYLQYALGLRALGFNVYWLEAFRTKGREEQEAAALATFRTRMRQHGFDGKFILYVARSREPSPEAPVEYIDMARAEAEDIFAHATLLMNFHYAISPGLVSQFQRTALVDIDPGLLQFWISRGQLSVPRHDFYFTIGETLAAPWIHIRPPVCLDHWPYVFDPDSDAFTTISNWDSSDWIVDGDETYENTKRVAFLEFADLPRVTRQRLELALIGRTERDKAEWKDLERRGWRIRRSSEVAGTPELYRAYIQASRGEFGCAKPFYVRSQNAWISDRTICYLASGKPVVVQNTGPSSYLPNGEGMFRFSTAGEAAAALAAIDADYELHCRSARRIAETWFDAKQVLQDVLNVALHQERRKPHPAVSTR